MPTIDCGTNHVMVRAAVLVKADQAGIVRAAVVVPENGEARHGAPIMIHHDEAIRST